MTTSSTLHTVSSVIKRYTMKLQRYLTTLVSKPIIYLTQLIQRSNFESIPYPSNFKNGFTSYNSLSPKQRNITLKSKLLVLLALVFIGTNFILTHLIFNVSNYSEFVQSSHNLDLYLKLNRRFLQNLDFMSIFNAPSKAKQVYVSDHVGHHNFNYNYSVTAFISHMNHIYQHEKDPAKYLQTHALNFHWADWIDLAPATPFVEVYDSLKRKLNNSDHEVWKFAQKMCDSKLRDKREPWVDQTLFDNHVFAHDDVLNIGICSAIEKYYYSPLPERVMLETDYHYFTMPVNQQRLKEPLGLQGISQLYYNTDRTISQGQIEDFNPNDRDKLVDDLRKLYIQAGYDPESFNLKARVTQDPSYFTKPNVPAMIKEYEAKTNLSKDDQSYLDFMRYSNSHGAGKTNSFYFTSLRIQVDVMKHELVHYNYPWMKQISSHEERLKIIHHTIRSWFKFAENAQVVSWFSYGNLYGWFFNSQNLPWDTDLDVQISYKEQDKLGRYYNNTLVMENPKVGDHLFLFQTNPWYMQHDDKQHIDSRYIEVRSGIYIDISAQWVDDLPLPNNVQPEEGEIAFHCKHFKWNTYNDIFPLRRTIFEGAQTYIPNKPQKVLHRLYGKDCTDRKYNEDHNWQKDLGMWIPNQICEKQKVPPTSERFDDQGQLTLFGACNNTEILKGWKNTHRAYEKHLVEFEKVVGKGEDASELSKEDLPIFRYFDSSEFQ